MTRRFSIEEIRNWLSSQGLLGQVNLSEENIQAANECPECIPDEDPALDEFELAFRSEEWEY